MLGHIHDFCLVLLFNMRALGRSLGPKRRVGVGLELMRATPKKGDAPFFLLFVRTNLNSTIERILFSLAGRFTLFL